MRISDWSSDVCSSDLGERFEGLLPPVVSAPAFGIRKPAVPVFTLDDYVAGGIMTADQAETLRQAAPTRQNVLFAGGTSTGNTPLPTEPLAERAKPTACPDLTKEKLRPKVPDTNQAA